MKKISFAGIVFLIILSMLCSSLSIVTAAPANKSEGAALLENDKSVMNKRPYFIRFSFFMFKFIA